MEESETEFEQMLVAAQNLEQTSSNESMVDTVFLEEFLVGLNENTMPDLLNWEVKPRLLVKNGIRPPPGSLSARQYLDYLLVKTKRLDLRVIRSTRSTLKFYSQYYQKKFPVKFFNEFDLGSHTFYVGKVKELDLYIVCKPNSDCECDSSRSSVTEGVANIIFEEIILKSLEK